MESKTATDRLKSYFPTIIQEDSNCRAKRKRHLLGGVQIREVVIVRNLDRRPAVEGSAAYAKINIYGNLGNGETGSGKHECCNQKDFRHQYPSFQEWVRSF